MTPQHAAKIFKNIFPRNPQSAGSITLWNGDQILFGDGQPNFSIIIKDARTFEDILSQPSLGFGEGYVNGSIEIVGHLSDALEWLYQNDIDNRLTPIQKARICWLHIKKKASLSQSRADVQFHYDKGNDFYKIWLDKGMNYSCAFFTREDEGLEEAQVNKIHRSLKKLRLRPGHKFLDIGCGWGSPLIEAVKTFGVRRAVGLTLSKKQYELGNQRIQEAGLSEKAEIRLQDYREVLDDEFGTYDRILSIGMFEHVGRENSELFFKTAARLLKNRGVFLLHTIGRTRKESMDPWITKYIFPGTYLPSLGELAGKAQKKGFDLVDVENLRQHYDRTLGHWAGRFEQNIDQIKQIMGEPERRMWLFYLHGCRMSFRYNPLHVFQLLFSKGRRHDWPLVREELYTS
ncbi:MAG TPA: class I SAM-dependent methyltransferase [Desulfobulbaceae bacterium]|nr:class I SAM-dependent methyltransferase [Desulfobulbaceae bacterium]